MQGTHWRLGPDCGGTVKLVLLDIDGDEARQAAEDVGTGSSIGFGCDVTSASDCQSAVEKTLAWAGKIDVLINNAGLTQKRALTDVTDADYTLITDVVLRGTLQMSQAVSNAM